MALFRQEFENLFDAYLAQLEDVYDAEKRLTSALPLMAEAATHPELKAAFQTHLRETEEHIRRLERVFEMLDKTPKRETCPAMKGLIAEGNEMIKAKGDDASRDAALIGAAQKVEHYEIATYGTLRTWARQMGFEDQAQILQSTLDEEGNADQLLTDIAEAKLNWTAAHA
jgi:ferritin-like metal-binding protein YciE